MINFLNERKTIVLATSADDRVTARTVSFANDGLEIYILSFNSHKKYKQIQANRRVALCLDHYQVEGQATLLGDPLGGRNQRYAAIYQAQLPREYEIWTHQPGIELVRIEPLRITSMEMIDGWLYHEHLDLEAKKAFRTSLGDETG